MPDVTRGDFPEASQAERERERGAPLPPRKGQGDVRDNARMASGHGREGRTDDTGPMVSRPTEDTPFEARTERGEEWVDEEEAPRRTPGEMKPGSPGYQARERMKDEE
jgi:hypothetical protein